MAWTSAGGKSGKVKAVAKHGDYKIELSDIWPYVLSECTPTESDEFMKSIVVDIDKLLFDISLSIHKKQ